MFTTYEMVRWVTNTSIWSNSSSSVKLQNPLWPIILALKSKSLPNPAQTANGGIISRPGTSTDISKNGSLANAAANKQL